MECNRIRSQWGQWIQINMGDSIAFKQYYLRSNAAQWSLYGSPNGTTTWTLIDSRVDASNVFFSTTTNTTAYSYYRFVIQKIVSGPFTNVQVNSVDFFVDRSPPTSRYYKLNNTKIWLSSVVNTGYSSIMQIQRDRKQRDRKQRDSNNNDDKPNLGADILLV